MVSKGHLPMFCLSSSGCHSTTSTALCCYGSLWQSDKVCPCQRCQLWVLLSVPSLGIRSLPEPCQLGRTLLQVQAHCVCFSWPCFSAALPSPQFWPCPFGWLHQVLHFHHLSASTTNWRDLEGNAFLFSPDLLCLLSGPILLPQFSRPPSPFSQSQKKKRSLLWPTTELDLSVFAVGEGDCFPQQHYQVCAWASRMCLLLTPHLECAEDPGTQQVFVY